MEVDMFDRFSRSWTLAGQCWDVLKQDKMLMIFPVFSGIAVALITASFAMPIWGLARTMFGSGGSYVPATSTYVQIAIFYAANYFVVIFFNTALVSVALARMEGREASVADGLRTATSRLPAILLYAAIAATVGSVLRAIEERVGFIGSLVAGIVGVVWSVATFLVVPVLAAEEVGPFEAIGRSASMLKATWGENIIGNGGIGLVMGLVMLLAAGVGVGFIGLGFASHSIALTVFAVLASGAAFLGLAVVSSTLHTIYSAALYRYASGATHWETIDGALLGQAFRVR